MRLKFHLPIVAMLGMVVFVSNAQKFTVLHNFIFYDGKKPTAGLILSSNILYGTTFEGATNAGEIFKINTDGSGFLILHNFTNTPDGANPNARLLLSGTTLYGTTQSGGIEGAGTIFSIDTTGSNYSIIHSFTNSPGEGANPDDRLILADNTIYGSTDSGGQYFWGTVFSIHSDGTGYTNLVSFTNIVAPIRLSSFNNTLYGTTGLGGTNGFGTIFSLGPNGTDFTILHHFTRLETQSGPPNGELVLYSNLLIGTTAEGGNGLYGTVFAINTNGTDFSIVYNFTNTNGQLPRAGLVLSGNKLYGTASGGGIYGMGNVFSVNVNGRDFTVFTNFTRTTVGNDNPTGYAPMGRLLLSGNTLYGTTATGGSLGEGVVFSLQIPIIVSAIVSDPDGGVSVDFSSVPTNTYLVEAASNLTQPIAWEIVSTNLADANGLWQFTDSEASNYPVRFYRSVSAP